jgi:hypothetical protein
MKALLLALGLLFLASFAELHATPPPRSGGSSSFSTADRSSSSATASRGGTQASPGPWAVFVPPDELDSVEILGVVTQPPEADGRRQVTVRIRYTLSSQPKAIVCLGFNSNASTRFTVVGDRWITRGLGTIELTATVAPVTWPDKKPFKAFVSLSAQPQPKQWSMLASDAQAMKPAVVASR